LPLPYEYEILNKKKEERKTLKALPPSL